MTRSEFGTSGSHFDSLSSRLTLPWSTSRSSSVDTYEIATAPLRKCIAGVAGTPVIDSPTARVSTSWPSTVTRTITAFRCDCVITSSTIRITASDCEVSVGAGGASERSAAGAQAVRTATALSTATRRVIMIRIMSCAIRRFAPRRPSPRTLWLVAAVRG